MERERIRARSTLRTLGDGVIIFSLWNILKPFLLSFFQQSNTAGAVETPDLPAIPDLPDEPTEDEESAYERLTDKVQEIYQTISLYLKISNYVRKDHQGFDIFKSEDGDDWTVVTDNGFGDKFNYGALRFLTLEEGMYITTANPFYGGQLYLLSNDRDKIVGDLNGDYTVSNADLVMLARYLVHMTELDENQLAKADYDGNGEVNNGDLVLLAREIVNYEA